MATNKRQAKIDRMEGELLSLQESHRAHAEQIEKLEAEQRGHMVAARVGKNSNAQTQIEQLSGKISGLRTGDAFDCVAIEQLSAELEVERATLRREQWQERCRGVRELIMPRVNGDLEKSILALALELKKQLVELRRSDIEIAMAALQLGHPNLQHSIIALRGSGTRRAEMIAAKMIPVLESPLSAQYLETIGRADPGAPTGPLLAILRELDEIAEIEPQEAERRALEAAAPAPVPDKPGTVTIGVGGKLPDLPGRTTIVV